MPISNLTNFSMMSSLSGWRIVAMAISAYGRHSFQNTYKPINGVDLRTRIRSIAHLLRQDQCRLEPSRAYQ